MPILEVRDLRKRFGTDTAVDGVSFDVRRGEVVGFLGPNGAGKTTTIHMLLGITLATSGSIRYFGKDLHEHRLESLQRINAASAFNTLLGRSTVYENLLVFSDLYLVENAPAKIRHLLERFEISDLANELYWGLSSGQRTRVNLVKALINDPEIVLMDEPTASLDPDIADKTLTLIEELRRERQMSILYTSHNMQEISRICDRVIFLDHGKIVAEDTPSNLTKRISAATLRLDIGEDRGLVEPHLKNTGKQFSFVSESVVEIHSNEGEIPELLFGLSHLSKHIRDIEIKKPTLEDVFLQIARTAV